MSGSRIGDKHTLLMAIRQSLIIAIGALEDYLGVERSIIPKRKRGKTINSPGD